MTTARKIVTRALRLIQVLGADEAGDSAEVVDALDALNSIWSTYSLGRLLLLAGTNTDFQLKAGVASYKIGPNQTFDSPRPAQLVDGSFVRYGSTDYPIGHLDQPGYNIIPYKAQQGIPAWVYYEPNAMGGNLTFYPVPAQDMVLHLSATLPFEQFEDLDTDYALPPGYESLLIYQLAVETAPEYGKEASATVVRMMTNYKRQVKRSNSEVPQLSLPGELLGGYGYGFYGGFMYAPPSSGNDPTPGPGQLVFGVAPLMFGQYPLTF